MGCERSSNKPPGFVARRMICAALAICVGLVMATPAGSGGLTGGGTESLDFQALLTEHGISLASVTSDAEALALLTSRLGVDLDLKESLAALVNLSQAARATPPIGSDLAEQGIRLVAELAAWHLAAAITRAADSGDDAALQAIRQQAGAQQSWLLGGKGRPHLEKAAALAAVVASFPPFPSEPEPSPAYAEYAAFLDRTYPRLTGSDASWLALAERDSLAGVRQRLMEYWDDPGRDKADGERFAAQYFLTRVRPVLTARITAFAIRAEAEAAQGTQDAWHRLHTWPDRAKEAKGLMRLCGTWSWFIHNHQTHQELKLVVSFGPPDQPEVSGPRPAKIVILGDGVYLRWEFQGGGYQEDSLLFAGEGQRLEGVFVNSAGARGAVTGKRTAPCPKR